MIPFFSTWLARTFALLLVAVGASWLPAAAASVPQARVADGTGQLLVIMDVSGSMERKDASGTSLIQGARSAVRDFVAEVPAETEIGLRFYGSDYAGDSLAKGCRDSRLAVPIAAASESGPKIIEAVGDVQPTGFTPIGHSLTQAAQDFSVEGERAIVLVSDGEDTCGDPSPCLAAKRLARGGIDVRVDTVGLFLQDDPAARKQLECIAAATGGTYVPADDTAALSEQLSAVSSRAIGRFQASGEEVNGGPSQTQAAAVEAGGTYADDILKGEARWYAVELSEGQQITITATDEGSVDYGCCLKYRLRDPTGGLLASESGVNDHGTASTHVLSPSDDAGVRDTGPYYLEVILDDVTSDEEYGALSYEFTVETTAAVVEDSATATPAATDSTAPTESSSPSEGVDEQPTPAAAASSEAEGAPALVWALLGLLGLAVLALTAMVLVLRRRINALRA